MPVCRWYQQDSLSFGQTSRLLRRLRNVYSDITGLDTERCFYIEVTQALSTKEVRRLEWIISHPLHNKLSPLSKFDKQEPNSIVIEVGPRLNFSTPFSTNAVSVCRSVGLTAITRIEPATRYKVIFNSPVDQTIRQKLLPALHDQMTECEYLTPIENFQSDLRIESWYEVDVLGEGKAALEKANLQLGLAFDLWDIDYYYDLFVNRLKRNPTSVECFDLAQSNSEHSRHWFFKGRMVIDGQERESSLLEMVMATQINSNQNNAVKFCDNSSALLGYELTTLSTSEPWTRSQYIQKRSIRHITLTAETHNFPTGVAPFSGATTGTGGRIRDNQAIGRGGHTIAGTAGYCFGNLLIPGYHLPWEDPLALYPINFASPLSVAIGASDGASDYGNKFGEPVISGFARSFGLNTLEGRREWIKPIMFSGGIGMVDDQLITKKPPQPGMKVVKIGGPVYRIGVGGGAASSVQVQGDNSANLDFGAVQRGDAEMEQKMNRVIRSCITMETNPICSIHDQGAGGNGNVLKELTEPAGALIYGDMFSLGDPTVSMLELWGAEYQESCAVLCQDQHLPVLRRIEMREKCPVDVVGDVTGDGKIVLCERSDMENGDMKLRKQLHPVDLDLSLILGKMPQKVFHSNLPPSYLRAVEFPAGLSVREALTRVLRLASVASKRYLTNKVDRSVTGLVAQQQCVGPLHTPLADVAVVALSHFDTVGAATAIGEQPVKMLVNPAAGARMTVVESLSNLVFAVVTNIKDIKCSANWMWAAKLPGEGALLYSACEAMCEFMMSLGVAVDGGKDSLSMAARVSGTSVKAPGSLVVSTYVSCPDVTLTVTPDLKLPSYGEEGVLLLVSLCPHHHRLGGSALAQVYCQVGADVPDVTNPRMLSEAFKVTQELVRERKLCSGHDISDGGLLVCVLEMAFAGRCGLNLRMPSPLTATTSFPVGSLELLFAEEGGWILEVRREDAEEVKKRFQTRGVAVDEIGTSTGYGPLAKVTVCVGTDCVLEEDMVSLMEEWEETSYRLEQLQTNPRCAEEERQLVRFSPGPSYNCSFTVTRPTAVTTPISVAVIREEGTNGDQEMAAALMMAGFEVWDVTMTDLLDGTTSLDAYKGVVFPGGFSYADVLGSGKGWAASLLFHSNIRDQLTKFRKRSDTFSLGVCNGCQLMALLGWLDPGALPAETAPSTHGDKFIRETQVYLDHNTSDRFESRFSTVRIEESSSVLLKGMSGSTLGVWVAHGEGRFTYRSDAVLDQIESSGCVAMRYVDEKREPTMRYPLNPNGSQGGVAGLCSPDGRHLAIMPHPERCVLPWQWPWTPPQWRQNFTCSPWLQLFYNAYRWSSGQR